jgi:hypothetical protein
VRFDGFSEPRTTIPWLDELMKRSSSPWPPPLSSSKLSSVSASRVRCKCETARRDDDEKPAQSATAARVTATEMKREGSSSAVYGGSQSCQTPVNHGLQGLGMGRFRNRGRGAQLSSESVIASV